MGAYITEDEIKELIEIENYLGNKENWSENTTKIWSVIEKVLHRREKTNERMKQNMRKYREKDKNYGR